MSVDLTKTGPTGHDTQSVDDPPPPTAPARRGRPMRRWGRLRLLSAAIAVAVIASGIVLIRDAAVALGWADGSMWTADALSWLDGATRDADWLWPAVLLLVLVGIWLLAWALMAPRARLVPVPGHDGVYLRTSGIERLAVTAARDVSGVEEASAQASFGRVAVQARTTGAHAIKEQVAEEVRAALAPLSDRYSVKVTTKGLRE